MTADPQTIDRPEGDARGPRRMQDAFAGIVVETRERLSRAFNIDPEQRRLEELDRIRRIRELFDFTLRDHFDNRADGHFQTFYTNLERAYGNKFIAPRLSPAYSGSDLMFAMYKDVDIHNNIITNNHTGNAIRVTADTIKFDQTTREDFNMDDAFEMALLAAHSKDMAGGKIKLTGTLREKAMLQHAIAQVNAAMDQTLEFSDAITIKNPVDINPEWAHEFAGQTLDRYLKKMEALPTPGMVREPDDGFDLDLDLPPAPPPPAPPPFTPLHGDASSSPPPAPPPPREHASARPFAGGETSFEPIFAFEDTPGEKALQEKTDIEAALLYHIQHEPSNQPPGEYRGHIENENGKFEVYHVNVDVKRDGNPVRVQYFFDNVAGRPILMYIPKGDGYEGLQDLHNHGHYMPDISLGEKTTYGPDVIPAAPDGFSLFNSPAFGGGAHNEPIDVDFTHVDTSEAAARAQRQIEATLDALVEQLKPRGWGAEPAYIGQVTGSVAFTYDKQGLFKKVKATTEQHLFTAYVDLYEDGKTPPTQIEYVRNEISGNIHLVSIARGEGYEGFVNNSVSRGVQRFPEEKWYKPEKGSPVLRAAKYYLPAAQFEDEVDLSFAANRQNTPSPPPTIRPLDVAEAFADKAPSGTGGSETNIVELEDDPFNTTYATYGRTGVSDAIETDAQNAAKNTAKLAAWEYRRKTTDHESGEESPVTGPRSAKLAAIGRSVVSSAVSRFSSAVTRIKNSQHKTHAIIATPFIALSGWALAQFATPEESSAATSAPSIAALTARTGLSTETGMQINSLSLEEALTVFSRASAAAPAVSEPPAAVAPPSNLILASAAGIRIKDTSVNITHLDSTISGSFHDVAEAWRVCTAGRQQPEITSGNDYDGHADDSYHYSNDAIDLSVRGLTGVQRRCVYENLSAIPDTRTIWELNDPRRNITEHYHFDTSGGPDFILSPRRRGRSAPEPVTPEPVLPPAETIPDTTIAATDGSIAPAFSGTENTDTQAPVTVASGLPTDRVALEPTL